MGYRALAGPVRGHGRDAWLYIFYSFGSGIGLGFIQVLLGLYVLSVGFGESFLATIEVVIALSSASCSFVAGVVIDRFGTRAALLVSAVALAGGRFLLVAFPSTGAMLGGAAVMASGIAFYWVSQGVVLSRLSTGDRRASLFGLNWTLYTLSSFLGGIIAGVLPGVLGPALGLPSDGADVYRYTIWVGVAVTTVASLPLLWMDSGRGFLHTPGARQAFWKVDEPRRVLRLLIPVATIATTIGFTAPFLSVFLAGQYNASTSRIGFVIGMFALVGSIGGLIGPWLRRRFGPVRAISGLLVASAPMLLLVGYAPGLGAASVALWGRGVLGNAAWPLTLSHLMESVPESQRGRVSALMNISFELSLASATLPAGLLMEHVDYRLPHALAAVALLVGGLGFAYAWRGEAAHPTERAG